MNINEDYYTVADYIFDPLGIIHPIEGKEKFKIDLNSPLIEKILQVAAKTLMTLAAALLTVGTLFIPFAIYCYRVSKEVSGLEEAVSIEEKFFENVHSEENQLLTLTLSEEQFKERLANSTLPTDQKIHVDEDLNLSNYTDLISLPNNLSVEGDLDLSGCTNLTSLPNNLSIEGSLDLEGCTSLVSLPNNLSVLTYLELSGCTSLVSLPDNLSVDGDLYLIGCTSLVSLPDNLSVAGSLHLRDCTRLVSLPDNLSVKINLDLRGCTSLVIIPNNLFVEGNIILPEHLE